MIGIPEVMVFFVVLLWALPLAAAIWALLTLHRMSVAQGAMAASLQRIEQLLERR